MQYPIKFTPNDLTKFNQERHQAQIGRLINIKILKYNQTKKSQNSLEDHA